MKEGKLTSEDLTQLIFSKLDKNREDTLKYPAIGEDVAYVSFGDEVLVLSTDPVTGAVEDLGTIALHIACNDIAAGGGEPVAVMLTVLAPVGTTKQRLSEVMQQAAAVAKELHVDIVGGHTEITSAVTRMVISTTVIGKAIQVLEGPQVGDAIVMTKQLGLEGTAIIVKDMPEMRDFLDEKEFREAWQMGERLSVVPESKIALKHTIHSMHDITEGGLIGALCEIVYERDFGFAIDEEKVPMAQVTRKIAAYYDIDPYQLISSGSMIISLPEEEAEALIDDLSEAGIEASVIGHFTEKRQRIFTKEGKEREVRPKKGDELYRVIG